MSLTDNYLFPKPILIPLSQWREYCARDDVKTHRKKYTEHIENQTTTLIRNNPHAEVGDALLEKLLNRVISSSKGSSTMSSGS